MPLDGSRPLHQEPIPRGIGHNCKDTIATLSFAHSIRNGGCPITYTTSQGLRIHYEIVGDGPPLLMHHGTVGSGQSWHIDGFVDALRSDYQVILIDARGHGQSDKPHDPDAYLGPKLAGDVLAVLDDLAIEKVHYWGYSLGARVGFVLADQAADRVASFILGGGHPYEAQMSLNIAQDVTDPEAVKAAFLGRYGLTPDTIPEQHRDALLGNDFLAVNASMGFRPSVEGALAKMTMPCLIYVGDADPIFANVQRATNQLSHAKFVKLPGLGHVEALVAKDMILPYATDLLRTAI